MTDLGRVSEETKGVFQREDEPGIPESLLPA